MRIGRSGTDGSWAHAQATLTGVHSLPRSPVLVHGPTDPSCEGERARPARTASCWRPRELLSPDSPPFDKSDRAFHVPGGSSHRDDGLPASGGMCVLPFPWRGNTSCIRAREAPSPRLARPRRQVERAPHDACESACASPAPVVQEQDARLFATHVVMDRDNVDPAGAERL